jgi:hypothetical integral membrane protein (TIGR02206 family)
VYDWRTDFRPYGVEHALFVAVCAVIMITTALIGRRLWATPAGETLRKAVGWVGVLYWIGSNAWWAFGPQYKFAQSLPLQVCDLAGLIGPAALLTGNRSLRAVLYFWGLGLSFQGFLQPVLKEKGFENVEFWLFWANHTVIVGTALYDVIALEFRPRARDFITAVLASLLYLAFMMPFNIYFQVNYGYVGPSDPIPHAPTLADKLGPWPLNAALLTLLGIAMMAMLWWPWEVFGRRRDGAEQG